MLALVAHAAEASASSAEASSGIGALGIDVRALVFQVVNFTLLLLVLRRFAYRPIVKVLEERRQRIAEGLRTAEELEHAKQALAVQHKKIIAGAYEQAEAIVARGEEAAGKLLKDAETKAAARAEHLIVSAETRIYQDTQRIRAELKSELLTLVALATERIIHSKLDKQRDADLIHQAIREAHEALRQ